MKKFLLFAGSFPNEGQGWRDYKFTADTIGEVHAFLANYMVNEMVGWWHIVSAETMEIVDNNKPIH
jgi:hypothetical protein